jgi:hypothetical protein
MRFDSKAYGDAVARILALDGDGERLMPLAFGDGDGASERALAQLKPETAQSLFPGSRAPEAALSGLYLYFSCFDEAHELAQSISSREGSYWHAIVHRQEPNAGNSGYWFRQVGAHPIFPALRDEAARLGVDFGAKWDPIAFIDFCEKAQGKPGPDVERQALEVQRAEWQLLFDYCARAARS